MAAELAALRARIRELERADREQYERSLSLLHATLESTADGLLVVDAAGNIVLFNQKFLDMWEIPPALASTGDDEKLLAFVTMQLKDPDEFLRRVRDLYGRPEVESFDVLHFADGRIFERYSQPQRVGGVSVGRVWSFRDVTKQRRAEGRLRESETRYRNLFSLAPVSIWEEDFSEVWSWLGKLQEEGVSDLAGYLDAHPEALRNAVKLVRVLDVNEATVVMFEASSREELIERFRETFTEETYKRLREEMIALWDGRGRATGQVSGVTLKGRRVDYLLHWVAPMRGDGPDLSQVIIALDDITERTRLERELLRGQKLESIGTLAGGIAHDFNNLLSVIVGQASIQLRDKSLPARMREALKDMLHAAERGSALTQQLLAFARGGLQKPAPTDLNSIVDSVMQILRRTAPPQVEFMMELAGDLPKVLVDPTQIEQVVMNLCLNGVQASSAPGRIEVTTDQAELDERRATDWGLSAGLYVRLVVRDFGRGMDEATKERIFEPFFTTKPTGRGMGLSVTLGVVQSHHGHIEVDSVPGAGTTMTVWLPAIASPKQAAGRQAQRPRPRTTPPPRGSETVLVVDDDPAVGRTVETILSSLGYCVVLRAEPENALSFLETNAEDVDLVLLDANLPRYPTEEIFERVRRLCPHAPVLLASGFDLREQCEKLTGGETGGFVQKPFTLMALATAVRGALDGS